VNKSIAHLPADKLLITGGGAHNRFLVKAIELETNRKIIVPDNLLADYKEALIFAFMGILRMKNETNCLSSVTGAREDSCCGVINKP
jgi:anhydro-N-acetylmuramic acid kinase